LGTNCYLVADTATRDAVVVDPGWDAPVVLDALAQHGWTARAVLLTHAHFDHIGAVAGVVAATQAPLAIHRWSCHCCARAAAGRPLAWRRPPAPSRTNC